MSAAATADDRHFKCHFAIAAAAGAIVGDGFSFWLGHNYRRQILRGWPLNRFPWLVDRSAQSIRNFKIKNPCRLEIDNEFKLDRLFDREVSGLVALRIGVRAESGRAVCTHELTWGVLACEG